MSLPLIFAMAILAGGFFLLARAGSDRSNPARPIGFVVLGVGTALTAASLVRMLEPRF